MDKTWMFVDRTTSKYDDGVDSFIRFAIVNSDDSNVIRCPCTKCRNAKLLHPNVVKDHLFVNGVLESYTTWFWHGENISSVPIEEKIESDFEVGDGLNTVEMVDAVYRDYETKPDGFVKLLSDAEKPLYSGCTTFNVLSTLVRLYNFADPFNNSAYFMDSMGRKAPNDVKDAVKLGLRLWNTERKVHSGTFKFQVVKAPQQPGGVECGYYVMHFMKDIVEKHILSTSEKAFDTKTYSQEEIDELRNEWAVYVGSFL